MIMEKRLDEWEELKDGRRSEMIKSNLKIDPTLEIEGRMSI